MESAQESSPDARALGERRNPVSERIAEQQREERDGRADHKGALEHGEIDLLVGVGLNNVAERVLFMV